MALQQEAARQTAPTHHTYVPWVTIDGHHIDESTTTDNDLLVQVCRAYTAHGGHHPACGPFVQDQ
jgi:hypothetical protein